MTDGSNMGISVKQALGAVLGDPEEAEGEEITPEQALARINAATPNSYEGGADCMARAVLRLFEQKPIAKTWPTNRRCAWILPSGELISDHQVHEQGIWQRAKGMVDPVTSARWDYVEGPDLFTEAERIATEDEKSAFDGCTGFMWGFAANQARWISGVPIHGNPAIIEVSGSDE